MASLCTTTAYEVVHSVTVRTSTGPPGGLQAPVQPFDRTQLKLREPPCPTVWLTELHFMYERLRQTGRFGLPDSREAGGRGRIVSLPHFCPDGLPIGTRSLSYVWIRPPKGSRTRSAILTATAGSDVP
mgnify:CR=1 FL=1